jgi:hypothetical protein
MYNPFVSVTYSLPIFACTNLYPRFLTELNFCLTFLPVFMHLFVYTRHAAKCHRRDRFWRRCHCQKWIQGVLNGKRIRVAAWTTDWDTAETKAREMEHFFLAAKPPTHQPVVEEVQTAPQRITIKEAVEAFLEDEEGRQLRKGTTGQSKTLLQQQLIPWATNRGLPSTSFAPVVQRIRTVGLHPTDAGSTPERHQAGLARRSSPRSIIARCWFDSNILHQVFKGDWQRWQMHSPLKRDQAGSTHQRLRDWQMRLCTRLLSETKQVRFLHPAPGFSRGRFIQQDQDRAF